MEFALWTRGPVMQFIEQEYGVKLSVRAIGDYLKRWGFTPQKPIKRAYEQRPEAVKQWINHEYPGIEKRAKAEAGEIHWGDETALVRLGEYGCAAPQLRAQGTNPGHDGGRWYAAETVDDFHGDQPREGELDDHRWRF